MRAEATSPSAETSFLLEACRLSKRYGSRRWFSRATSQVVALDDVSLSIRSKSTLALVGGSGAGKSTLGRCLARLDAPDSGEIWFEGRNLLEIPAHELRAVRRRIQFIFQDPGTAINPRFSALEVVEEPLRIQFNLSNKTRRDMALAMMDRVGVTSDRAERPVSSFSGGQRQRLAIARALVLEPRLLILDEALSSLDRSTQAQMLELLRELRASLSLTYLFITHDLLLGASIADRMAVMDQGRIIECDDVSQVLSEPQNPYTRKLIAAIPAMEPPPQRFAAAP